MMDSTSDTLRHIRRVGQILVVFVNHLLARTQYHDESKLEEPEKSFFDKYSIILSSLKYGSDQYRKVLAELKPALDHHYQMNRHHPEHWANGISDMDLVDLVEMFCDWVAATERAKDGNIAKSIEFNEERFGIA